MAAQELKTQDAPAGWSASAATLTIPYVGMLAVAVEAVWVPSALSAPPHYDVCLNCFVHVGIVPVVWLPPQSPVCAVFIHLDVVSCGQCLIAPLHRLMQWSVQARPFPQVKLAALIMLCAGAESGEPPYILGSPRVFPVWLSSTVMQVIES